MTRNPIVRDVVALAALVLIGVGIPIVLVVKAHAVGLPHNDDWVYMLGADTLYRSGAIALPGHSAAAVGQLVLVQPLLHLSNGHPWAFTAFGLGMTALGIAATYLLARAFVSLAGAVFVTGLLIAFPGFERQAASFMTDVPAFALEMLSLLLGVVWLRSGRRTALAGSILVGLLGVSIREFAMIAPAAVLGISLARSPSGARRPLLAATALTAVGIAAELVVVRSPAIAGGMSQPDATRIFRLAPTLSTLAAVLLPAIVLAVGRHLRALTPIQLVTSLAVVMIAVGVAGVGSLIGNSWAPTGMLGSYVLAGTRQPVLGDAMWSLDENVALLASVLALALVFAWARPAFAGSRGVGTLWRRVLAIAQTPSAVLLLFLLGYAATLAVAHWRMSVFDRYLYPMVPAGAIALVAAAGQVRWLGRAQIAAYAALGLLSLSAAMTATNSFAYDAARWRAGEAAVAAGYAAPTVDAGYEWVGFHATPLPAGTPGVYGPTNYEHALLSVMPCAIVSNSRLDLPSYTPVPKRTTSYRQFLFFGPGQRLYLYARTDPRCPAPGG